MKAAIIGLGLMGGSLGLALKKYNIFETIVGYDHNTTHQKEALELSLVDSIATIDEVLSCDTIFLAIPVEAIISFLHSISTLNPMQTIIDLGSTKELITKNVPPLIRSNFVAAHPMTGTEKFGPTAALDGLYENKVVVLCDLEKSGEYQAKHAQEIFAQLKMNLVLMDAKNHDIHACYMSHLPHAISYALANTVMEQEDPKSIITLAAGGFRDMSRIAKSSPNMWCDIFRQNKANLLTSLELYENHIKTIKNLLAKDDFDAIKAWMSKANTLHEIL